MTTATTIHRIRDALAHTRQYAKYLAETGNLTAGSAESLVDDACAAGALGSEARAIVDEVGAEVAAKASKRLESGAARVPTFKATEEDFIEILTRVDKSLRWNKRSDQAEVRHGGEEWIAVDDLQTDLIFNACSKVANVTRGSSLEPWGARTARQERRLINVVARRVQVDGEGSAVYQTVAIWAAGRFSTRLTLNEIMTQAGVLQRFEVGARAPVKVREDVKRALIDAGWIHKVSRRDDKPPAMLWVSPTGPPTRPRRVRVLAP